MHVTPRIVSVCGGPSTERPVTASTLTRIVTNFFIALNWRLSFTKHIQRPWSPLLAWYGGGDDDGDNGDNGDDNGDDDDDDDDSR